MKSKNFGAADELQVIGAVSNNCHAELVSASDQYGANVNFQTEKTLKAEKADGIYAGKREPKSRQRSEVMTGASAKRFQEQVQGDSEWDAKGNGNQSTSTRSSKKGFTLAEVLITLVVIGVVAAITIPVLHSNTGGKEFNAAKQKARASLGEAFKLASLNQELEIMSAKDFIKTVLPKYLKFAKTCDTAAECGFSDYIKTPEGKKVSASKLNSWDTITNSGSNETGYGLAKNLTPAEGGYKDAPYKEAGYFQTVDGFSVSLLYNPQCRSDREYIDNAYPAVCFNAVYDMNGAKGPNTVGKDVGFVGSFYSGIGAQSAAVLPVPGGKYFSALATFDEASQYCKSLGADYDLPTINEGSLMFLNSTFLQPGWGYSFWTRTVVPGDKSKMYHSSTANGQRIPWNRYGRQAWARCVRVDKLM